MESNKLIVDHFIQRGGATGTKSDTNRSNVDNFIQHNRETTDRFTNDEVILFQGIDASIVVPPLVFNPLTRVLTFTGDLLTIGEKEYTTSPIVLPEGATSGLVTKYGATHSTGNNRAFVIGDESNPEKKMPIVKTGDTLTISYTKDPATNVDIDPTIFDNVTWVTKLGTVIGTGATADVNLDRLSAIVKTNDSKVEITAKVGDKEIKFAEEIPVISASVHITQITPSVLNGTEVYTNFEVTGVKLAGKNVQAYIGDAKATDTHFITGSVTKMYVYLSLDNSYVFPASRLSINNAKVYSQEEKVVTDDRDTVLAGYGIADTSAVAKRKLDNIDQIDGFVIPEVTTKSYGLMSTPLFYGNGIANVDERHISINGEVLPRSILVDNKLINVDMYKEYPFRGKTQIEASPLFIAANSTMTNCNEDYVKDCTFELTATSAMKQISMYHEGGTATIKIYTTHAYADMTYTIKKSGVTLSQGTYDREFVKESTNYIQFDISHLKDISKIKVVAGATTRITSLLLHEEK